jgi:hypothetical protein
LSSSQSSVATGAVREYACQLRTGSRVSGIVAINHHQFLVDERDGKGLGDGSMAGVKQAFRIDLNGAIEVSGLGRLPTDQLALKAAAIPKTLMRLGLSAIGFVKRKKTNPML